MKVIPELNMSWVRIPLNGVILPHFCAFPKPGPGCPMSYVVFSIYFVFSE
jgi:hypothetical protein